MALDTFSEALDYLYANLPIFQRVGSSAYKPDLTNTLALCRALGDPQNTFKSIHVAGTNGKESTSHMLASVLQSAGYKTGLYTSPHLKEFTERIRINGEEISKDFVVEFVKEIRPEIEKIKPSFFEITVAMACKYFADEKIDVAVMEVGLGGRLDSTNVILPELSLITNIGWDHKDILGDTLEKIASEKAGIIKPSVPVVVSEKQSSVRHVFEQKASEGHSPIFFASDEFQAEIKGDRVDIRKDQKPWLQDVMIPLKGLYQQKNLPGVLKAIEILNSKGFFISKDQIVHGLEKTVEHTHLKGRWQKIGDFPLTICDTGHNIDGVREVVHQISLQKFDQLRIVWGAVKDKDIRDIISILPSDATYYFCQAKIPRAMDAGNLSALAHELGLKGTVVPDVNEALARARAESGKNDMIFIGGSTFVVAEIHEL